MHPAASHPASGDAPHLRLQKRHSPVYTEKHCLLLRPNNSFSPETASSSSPVTDHVLGTECGSPFPLGSWLRSPPPCTPLRCELPLSRSSWSQPQHMLVLRKHLLTTFSQELTVW
ncbi:unnamed protein product [Gulo gulo]|uniref:Uncharacterized protein n=1 Tax=Gulo gulo TaxID=48420 RepID=A0A9X9LSA6_GULGU|nr:unnamed protein product [Gulo gulo]